MGGQGSGDFGHVGRKGEVGGSSNVFHGTSTQVIKSIQEKGLTSRFGVYGSISKKDAIQYGAEKAVENKSTKLAIVVCDSSVFDDDSFKSIGGIGRFTNDFRISSKNVVKPKFIKSIEIYNVNEAVSSTDVSKLKPVKIIRM